MTQQEGGETYHGSIAYSDFHLDNDVYVYYLFPHTLCV